MKQTIKLKLSSALTLPPEAVTQTIGILAKRGAGKTYTASVLAEEFVAAKLPFCVLDPTGAWWGLRVLADGKPGLPVIIIGGKHGDIPLEPAAGKLIADLIVDNPGFYVLDMSLFESNAAQDRFATDFAEHLYRRKQRSREPLHLFVDEADSFAPQRPYRGQERMLGAFEALSRRGRIYGIGVTLISQRAAVINKNVLSQIEMLIALQTTAPQDRDAIESWAEGHGTTEQVKELMGSLASLSLGEAWVWSPSWLELFKRVQIRKRLTFNSSATPKVGEIRREPKALAPVDIEKLRKKMADTIERVKADDPQALRRQIAELKKHKCPIQEQKSAVVKRVEIPVLKDNQIARLEKIFASMVSEANRHGKAMDLLWGTFNEIGDVLLRALEAIKTGSNMGRPTAIPLIAPLKKKSQVLKSGDELVVKSSNNIETSEGRIDRVGVEKDMGNGEKKILIAIAQHDEGVTRGHITVLTGYKRSTRDTYIQRLRIRGLVDLYGDMVKVTDAGVEMLGPDFEPLPTGEALRDHLSHTLPEGERKILTVLIEAYPDQVDRQILSDATGYQRSTRDTYLQRLNARKLVSFDGRGLVKASGRLFD